MRVRMHNTNSALCILGVTDARYFPCLLVLARSVIKNMPEARFRAHLINVSDDAVTALRALSSTIEITREDIKATDIKTSIPVPPEDYQKLLAAYSENRRAALIHEMLGRGDPYVFYLDADAIVRRPLFDLMRLLKKADGLLLRQASVHTVAGTPRDRFAGGALAFRNTTYAQVFVSRWAALVAERIDDRFANQECLALAYTDLEGHVSINDLPFKFIDWEFSLASPVWIKKGPGGERPLYRLEVFRYTNTLHVLELFRISLLQMYYRCRYIFWQAKSVLLANIFAVRDRLLGRVPYAEKEGGLQNPPEDVRYKDRPHNAP